MKIEEIRGTPMDVGELKDIINENNAIVSTSLSGVYYVSILSFVDKDLLIPGCNVLLHHKVNSINLKLYT